MNRIRIHGILRRGDKEYVPGYLYWLDVARRSGTIDRLIVLSPDPALIEGEVYITGHLHAEYLDKVGVPVFIVPEAVEPGISDGTSRAELTGIIKADPICRFTVGAKTPIASIILKTDEGPIPVIVWGGNAKRAAERLKAGMEVRVVARLQSRMYPDKNGDEHTTYELSASQIGRLKLL